MTDPLAEVVALLKPRAGYSKLVSGAGRWRVRREEFGEPFYCVVLEGGVRLSIDDTESMPLRAGDFILIPAARGFMMSSLDPPASNEPDTVPIALPNNEFRVGLQDGDADYRGLIGHCVLESPDAKLLVSLLPQFLHVHDEGRLAALVQLVRDESRASRPARDMVLARLLEVLLIEALRSTTSMNASPGLLRGLADARLAVAIRLMHERPTESWTVVQLAKEAALSRSAFFERFNRAVGVAPMEYLLAWRMALAKNLLKQKEGNVAEVAQRVGYRSASTFSVAFARHVGIPPTHYARGSAESP